MMGSRQENWFYNQLIESQKRGKKLYCRGGLETAGLAQRPPGAPGSGPGF